MAAFMNHSESVAKKVYNLSKKDEDALIDHTFIVGVYLGEIKKSIEFIVERGKPIEYCMQQLSILSSF